MVGRSWLTSLFVFVVDGRSRVEQQRLVDEVVKMAGRLFGESKMAGRCHVEYITATCQGGCWARLSTPSLASYNAHG